MSGVPKQGDLVLNDAVLAAGLRGRVETVHHSDAHQDIPIAGALKASSRTHRRECASSIHKGYRRASMRKCHPHSPTEASDAASTAASRLLGPT